MTTWLKQSTATDVELGPFVDDTDGKTAETGLTISQADCQLIKNGGAAAQKNDSTSATHLAGGHYKVPLNTTDTNTLGRLRLYVNESGALPVWRDFMVLPANTYDSLVGGSDYLDVSAVQIAGSAVSTTTAQIGVNVVQISEDATAANNAEAFFDGTGYAGTNNTIPTVTNVTTVNGLAANVITASAIAADAIGASELAADAATEIGTAVWATAARTLTAATNVTSTGAAVPITAGGLVSADVTAISTDTTAANNAESFFDGTGYAGTNNVIPTVTTATNVTTVNGLAAGVITAAAIATNAIDADALAADAVTEIQSGLATAAALTTIDDFLDTEIAAILADTNELQTDWVNGGRLDLLIDAIKAKTDTLPADTADDSDIDTQLAAIAAYLDTEVAAILAAVDTEVAAIKTKTDYLPSATAGAAGGVFIAGSNAATTVAITGNITGNLSGSVGSVTGAVGSVTGNVGGNVTGSVGSLAAQAKTDVNAEVVDALATDTYAELGAVPAATSTLKDKINWLFMLARNARTTTATIDAVRNDANSANVATSTLNDDGTTFTRGEYS